MNTLEHLEGLMSGFDWNYRFSDDSYHWNRCDQMLMDMSRMSAELAIDHRDQVENLWKKYSPPKH